MNGEEAWLAQLAQDHHSGAAEIAARVATWLAEDPADWAAAGRLARFGLRCMAAQPSMAPLVNLFNDLLWTTERSHGDIAAWRATLSRYRRPKCYRPLPSGLCPDGSVILTFSYSSSVLGVLLAGRDRLERVLCLESRPLLEGRMLCERLAHGGIKTTLLVDAAMAHAVNRADLVVVGADSIHPGGLVNKQGTHALALLARGAGKKAIAIASKSKLLGREAADRFIKIRHENPGEVWDSPPPGVSVENYYFDVTPLDLFDSFQIDGEMIPAPDLHKILESYRIHQLLTTY